MKHILVSTSSFYSFNSPQICSLQQNGFQIIFNPFKRKMTDEEILTFLQKDVFGMIAGVESLHASILEKAKSLKVISRCGTGLDNIDLTVSKKNGILVYNTPSPVNAVAELTLTHMLTLLRKIIEADQNIRQGEWKPLMGNLLASKVIGIIGCGQIGQAVANLVLAFGARVLIYDERNVNADSRLIQVSLDELLSQSDIITLHLPYNRHTHHFVNSEKLKKMKASTFIINTSRGGIIDEYALYQSLKSNKLAGAGIDVFEKEPYRGVLCELNNVVLTSHMGSYALESRIQMELAAIQNLYSGLLQQGLL